MLSCFIVIHDSVDGSNPTDLKLEWAGADSGKRWLSWFHPRRRRSALCGAQPLLLPYPGRKLLFPHPIAYDHSRLTASYPKKPNQSLPPPHIRNSPTGLKSTQFTLSVARSLAPFRAHCLHLCDLSHSYSPRFGFSAGMQRTAPRSSHTSASSTGQSPTLNKAGSPTPSPSHHRAARSARHAARIDSEFQMGPEAPVQAPGPAARH